MSDQMIKCADCGEDFEKIVRPGRPAVRCEECKIKKTKVSKPTNKTEKVPVASICEDLTDSEVETLEEEMETFEATALEETILKKFRVYAVAHKMVEIEADTLEEAQLKGKGLFSEPLTWNKVEIVKIETIGSVG